MSNLMQWCMNGFSSPPCPGKGFRLQRMYVRLLWDNVHVYSSPRHKSCHIPQSDGDGLAEAEYISVTQIEPVHCKLMGSHRKLIMHIIIWHTRAGWVTGIRYACMPPLLLLLMWMLSVLQVLPYNIKVPQAKVETQL